MIWLNYGISNSEKVYISVTEYKWTGDQVIIFS